MKKLRTVCYGYVRVSTEKQAEEGVSLSAQRDLITKKAYELGMELVNIYCDAGISGSVEERPELQKLLETIKEGECIIVYDLSRLTRDFNYFGKLQYDFKKRKIRLVSVAENTDTNSKDNQYMMSFRAIMGDMEWEGIKRKVKMGMDKKKELDEHVGRVPYGYKLRGKKGEGLVEDPEEQVIIQRIKDMVNGENGYEKTSYNGIAREFNKEGVKTTSKAQEWFPSTIRKIYLREPIATKGRLDRNVRIVEKIIIQKEKTLEEEIEELKAKKNKTPEEYDHLIALMERKSK